MYVLNLPFRGYVRISQIVGDPKRNVPPIVPVCKATIWAWVKSGKFPEPVKLSPSITVWRTEDIRDYIESTGKDTATAEGVNDGR